MKEIGFHKVNISGESYYKISNNDRLIPFFMSIVSDSNHWMFISSNGGLTAGRINSDHALFPYYTDDKITESFDLTGSKSIFRVKMNDKLSVWEPFSNRFDGLYDFSRNLYKNVLGNKIMFEEINHDLGLIFKYQWSSSDNFGFVRECSMVNTTSNEVIIEMLDGIQNIIPYGVNSDLQFIRSNLVDAYKKSELEAEVGLGIYALSSIIVDRAEPSEALKANIAWSSGLDNPTYLLCSKQLNSFREGRNVEQETDIKAEKGAYFVSQQSTLRAEQQIEWTIVANVNQSASSIAEMRTKITKSRDLMDEVKRDIAKGSEELINLTSTSDGHQLSNDQIRNTRHYSNTLFNIMRGGVFDHNYRIDKKDFCSFLETANAGLSQRSESFLEKLSESFSCQEIKTGALKVGDKDLIRLVTEYLPLKFSRRHGDPSRPWNRFSINTKNDAGEKILDYEGNWRDIFQNWEALAHSYPEFIEGMIFKFLNASTFDGYNPYRVTKDGFDWEVIEENDPWSYIGYWGDHQIIYLLKFLEFIEDHYPGRLIEFFNHELFVFANVPYKIRSYDEILKNPKDTIVFDEVLDNTIRERRNEIGGDGALIQDANGSIVKVNLIEKLLVTALAKLSNFIPEGGIWLNTQRPEWNDANNALVGNGVSMVTLCYLRRFFNFFLDLLNSAKSDSGFDLSDELHTFFKQVEKTLSDHESILTEEISGKKRKDILDSVAGAATEYRNSIYKNLHSGNKKDIALNDLKAFSELVLKYLDHTIAANKRNDNMYHTYNLMSVENGEEVTLGYLEEMLEGQVAVLSSGKLTHSECLEVMDALKASSLFREDQFSYILYPNKELPRFVEKNNIPESKVENSSLLKKLVDDGNIDIIEKDINGNYHFNGRFTNAGMLEKSLSELSGYQELADQERGLVLQIFEDVFNHKAFTGRSGTFFGYEGLGSIYWHMVSKLLLAVQECCLSAIKEDAEDEIVGRMLEHYYEINEGIGVHKSPELYGAFPVDPYSHTPYGKGVQQPGMTGQVKEDILTRMGELGVLVKDGRIHFNPVLLKSGEFIGEETLFEYIDVNREKKHIPMTNNSLVFTYCQIPVLYLVADHEKLVIDFTDGSSKSSNDLNLDTKVSQNVFRRNGVVESIRVQLKTSRLR